MAPSKFQIYVDQSMRQPQGPAQQQPHHQQHQQPAVPMCQPPNDGPAMFAANHQQPPPSVAFNMNTNTNDVPRYMPENLDAKNQRFFFDERKLYPIGGGEYSFEELNYFSWLKRQRELSIIRRCEEAERENEELKQKLEAANQQLVVLANAIKQLQLQGQQQQQLTQTQPMQTSITHTGSIRPQSPTNRLSIVPQSLQPANQGGLDYADMSCYGAFNEAPSVVQDCWKNTLPSDKFTVPIDQSQYIRDNVPTSTPTSKNEEKNKRPCMNNRRISRASMGGSPTLKLSPITETSRDCNSKSSSSSSAISTTPGTTKKPLVLEPLIIDEPDRPLDPNDPRTYRKLLRALAEPLDQRPGFVRVKDSMPDIKNGVCFGTGSDNYLVDKQLSVESKMHTAQLLNENDDSDTSDSDIPVKTVCLRVDSPSNEWMFYICNELHKRLVRQKTQPDIELSVMNADPGVFYSDGSILIDEYFRFVTLEDYFVACSETERPFPRSVAAFLALELIQLVRSLHTCGIIHMNITSQNLIITGCPNREDIAHVHERISIVKLIGFENAMDARLLPANFKFSSSLERMPEFKMLAERPWIYEPDWFGFLSCIYKMFYLEPMIPKKDGDKWIVDKQFKGLPTDIWTGLFETLLNTDSYETANAILDRAVDELRTWIKANISFVLKEAANLDMMLEEFCKKSNKSVRI